MNVVFIQDLKFKGFMLLQNFKNNIKLIVIHIILFFFFFTCTVVNKTPKQEGENIKQNSIDTKYIDKKNHQQYKSTIIVENPNNINIDQSIICDATFSEKDELVISLINNGANLYCKSKDGIPFIDLAVHRLKEETVLYIFDIGFDIMRLNDVEINNVFLGAIFQKKIGILRKMIEIDGIIEKVIINNKLSIDFMRHWADGTGEILIELIKKGFILPDDGSLYYYVMLENSSYKAVEWLIAHNFSTSVIFKEESISYWANVNLNRRRKSYDDSIPPLEDSINVNNAKKIKELIDENVSKGL